MTSQQLALMAAGVVGAGTAVMHGILLQRLMIVPLRAWVAGGQRVSASIAALVAPLLHFTTFSWFAGGVLLIFAAFGLGHEARMVISLFVGSQYLYGVVANFRATKGRHYGWMLMALATGLIAVSLTLPA